MVYAQIDPESKLCIGIHQMSEYHNENYIEVDSYDTSYLGKLYDSDSKTFIENPNPPQPVQIETTEQKESDTTLTMMETIAENYEEIQNLKAEIEALKGASA